MGIRRADSSISRPRRRIAVGAVLATLGAALSVVVVSVGVAPSASARPTAPAENYSPPLTGGPAGQACAGIVYCVGPGQAYTTIQSAINAASSGATIQVKAGTYNERLDLGNKSLTILGGFPQANWTTRDPAANVTTINGQNLGRTITANGEFDGSGSVTLDGLRIINGRAPIEFAEADGSGISITGVGTVLISHNVIENNDDGNAFLSPVTSEGGGLLIKDAVNATVQENIIRDNQAQRGAALSGEATTYVVRGNLIENNDGLGDHGGAIYLGADQTTIEGNLVRGNRIGVGTGADAWGGGGHFSGPGNNATLSHNRWVGNSAPAYGSGFFVDDRTTATITGDIFARNTCGVDGGAGLAVDGTQSTEPSAGGAVVTLVNVTITEHSCPGSIHGSGVLVTGGSQATIRNSIVSGNGGAEQVIACTPANSAALECNMDGNPARGPSSASYSLLGSTAGINLGTGMIAGDPQFVSLPNDNYHLGPNSPAIDAGDPADPVENEPAPNGGRRNAGAYGGTAEATPTGATPSIVNQTPPAITGTPQVGSVLTASTGTWTNAPTGFAYQWQSGGTNVGTNSNTYTPVVADVGNTITVTVTATRAGHTSGMATSGPTAAVTPNNTVIQNQALPVISGNAMVGNALTASTGTWTNEPTGFTYQWRADGANVGTNSNTYTPVVGDVGDTITVTVTATRMGYTPGTATSASTAPVNPAGTPSIENQTVPVVTGNATVGGLLTASNGTWTNAPTGFDYRWRSGGVVVGTNTNTYTPVVADVGRMITVTVSATRAGYNSGMATSAPTAPVTDAGNTTIVNQAVPVITGPAVVGSVLTASTGTWTNAPTGFSYQWFSVGLPVGTNSNTYVPVAGDLGNTITVSVTATRPGYTAASATSAPTAPVAPAGTTSIENQTVPVISGTAVVGSVLTASNGAWSNEPTGFDYQWRSGGLVVGTNANSYVPVAGDVGRMITVMVTATRPGHNAGTATSAPTTPVTDAGTQPIENQTVPTISGIARVGSVLTAGNGTWTNAPTAFDYQWRSGGAAVGTNANSYVPTANDLGNTITVTVVARRPGFTSGTASSAPTAAVTEGNTVRTPRKPVVTGKARVGKKIKMSVQQAPAGYIVAYRWLRGTRLIQGATTRAYRPVRKDRGNKIYAAVIWIAPTRASPTRSPRASGSGSRPLGPDPLEARRWFVVR